jgi:hypothetical protein
MRSGAWDEGDRNARPVVLGPDVQDGGRAWAGRLDLLEPLVELVPRAARADGYLNSYYDVGPGSQGRYGDLATSHEGYCAGHLVEAALAHHTVTGDTTLLDLARRWADHHLDVFGPGRDERTDGHPEAELALARLARHTGDERYLDQARWIIERQLADHDLTVASVDLTGHAVKALYLARHRRMPRPPGTGVARGRRTLFDQLVDEHAYPGSRGAGSTRPSAPYEQPDTMSYTESCAAVASVRFCQRVWDLTRDPRALDQIELLLFNAVPCGTGADGESWFYSQPHAVADLAGETNPWVTPFEYSQSMLLSWFPARRHRWFVVSCCPPNLARLFATVHHHVAELDTDGDLLVHLPVAGRITAAGWDVEVRGRYPDDGAVSVVVHEAPPGRTVRVRRPGWAGGHGHVSGRPTAADLPVPTVVETDRRVEVRGGAPALRSRRALRGGSAAGVDLRSLVVDPAAP